MKSVVYHRLAESELVDSAEFYERRRPLLGGHLLDAVMQAEAKIRQSPQLGKPGKFRTRSGKIGRFPFRIVYLEQTERIWIVAVAHLSRKPDYWLERLTE
jgi:plasmid stabilization system protein ParE